MNNKKISNGIYFATAGSVWWGVLGTYFFQYISYAGAIEVVLHRSFWTFIILFITTIYLKKWSIIKQILLNKKKNFYSLYYQYSYFFKLGNLDIRCFHRKNNRCKLRIFYFPNY